ncbi:amidohydrolase, partial [Streptomyces sp. SID7982]|nr:amidohydrolase [Streptomyces sp. SID7982]
MPKTVVTGGRVLTFDPSLPEAEALVLAEGRVLAAGSSEEMLSLAGPGARRVDAQGGTVMPGLIDTHPHALHFG